MNLKHFPILLFSILCYKSLAQVIVQKKDSTEATYRKIENYSTKTETTKFLHKLLFKETKQRKKSAKWEHKQFYAAFEGKIIRNINVESHDPFGYSFTDSTERTTSWIEQAGNQLHARSKDFTIRNLLIFKKHTPLDSLLLIESERLIRSQNFIRSVQLSAQHIAENPDSVDVYIKVLDSWSLIPNVSLSGSKMKLQVNERSYLGWGHQLNVGITNRFDDGKLASNLLYTVPNFKNTYISTTIGHTLDLNDFYYKRFNMERPFFSPYTKWAGGVYLDKQYRQEKLADANLEFSNQNFKYTSQDIWAGYSLKLFQGNTERERTANGITSFRVLHIDYLEKPTLAYDSIRFFSNETFYLGSLGIASRQFLEDNYIYRDGIIENVPVGDTYAITAGVQNKNGLHKLYLGAKIAHGNYYDWGYLSANFEYGTFFRNSKAEQTAYSFSALYFTNLLSLGGEWHMRQFVKPQFLIGTNRLNSIGDRVTIDERNDFQDFYGNEEKRRNSMGIPGFDSNLMGTSKYIMSYQSQFYPPWELWGFRLNPYLNINVALLGNEERRTSTSDLYTSFGLGLIIRNDYLVFGSFQLSFSYFPNIPGQGNNIFNTNAFKTEDFGFEGFELGKPLPVWYN